MAAIWLTGETWFRVPETIGIRLSGRLTGAAEAKDIALSIVGRLMRAHGGWCDVESVEGEGTTFTVHLPAEGRKS